jgi:hypothetical protein
MKNPATDSFASANMSGKRKSKSSTANAGKLLKSLSLPQDTTSAKRWLRSNGKIVVYNEATVALATADPRTVNGKFDKKIYAHEPSESGHYENSLELCRVAGKDDVFEMYSDTICDGDIQLNFECTVKADGTVLSGGVNTFSFGMMKIDQGYIDELLREWSEVQYKWDAVTSTAVAPPPAKRTKSSGESTDQEASTAEAPSKQSTDVKANEPDATTGKKSDAETTADKVSVVASQ